MLALRKARALPRGGTIGLAAPAGPVDPERLAAGEELLRERGYRVLRRDDLLARRGYLAGDDARRAKELMDLVRDDRVDAIVCARGGYGCHRIVSALDAEAVRSAAKPLAGYSDITTLLLWQRRCAGLVGFHGPMLERGAALEPGSLDALLDALGGEGPERVVLRGRPGIGGRATGRLVGGSLSLVTASLGTPWEIDTRGAILMLEEIGERPYRLDRMLQQLRSAGKLERLAGVGVGWLIGCEDPKLPSPTAEEVIEEIVRPLGIPLVWGIATGHSSDNLTWPYGVRARLDGERGELHVLERGVESS
jgi:muramoyltetrapeptide carboxypeptidase